jgi:hypothetical protein
LLMACYGIQVERRLESNHDSDDDEELTKHKKPQGSPSDVA